MKSLKRFRNRQHRCYELSFIATTQEPDAEKFTLVHGHIHIYGVPVGHAWIETGYGRIYDTFLDCYMPCEQYVAEHGAVAERRYSLKRMAELVSTTRHSGPWHTSPWVVRRKTPGAFAQNTIDLVRDGDVYRLVANYGYSPEALQSACRRPLGRG